MEVPFVGFTVNATDLECSICRMGPKPHGEGSHFHLCDADHLVCGCCKRAHEASCGGALASDCCPWLEEIASTIYVKCACGGYFPYCMLKQHQTDCFRSKLLTCHSRKCLLMEELVRCSVCRATLRPPIFKPSFQNGFVCGDCRHDERTDDDFVRCPDLDYLIKCLTKVPLVSPCDEDETNRAVAGSNIIVGKTNGKAPSKFGKTDKHIVGHRELETSKRVAEASLTTSTSNKKANIATASGKKTDEYKSTRSPVGNSTNKWKSMREARPMVHKMDNHIVLDIRPKTRNDKKVDSDSNADSDSAGSDSESSGSDAVEQ